jgi:hypothetical protein
LQFGNVKFEIDLAIGELGDWAIEISIAQSINSARQQSNYQFQISHSAMQVSPAAPF